MLYTTIFLLYLIAIIFIASSQPSKNWFANAQQDAFLEDTISPSPSQSIAPSRGKTFVWKPSVRLHQRDNWLNEDTACDGDRLQLDRDNNLATIMLEQNLKADMIEFPSNGVIFFGAQRVVVGEAGRWQCNKRKSSEIVYFKPVDVSPNFYRAGNWHIWSRVTNGDYKGELREIIRPRLDTELVPGQHDDVIFPTTAASQVFLDSPIHVASLNFSNKLYTTTSFYGLLLTLEGQIQFRLGPEMRKTFPLNKIDYQWPDADQFLIGMNDEGRHVQQKANPLEDLLGHTNSNNKEPYLSGICELIHCHPTNSYCSQPVKPVGQCCPQCGAFLTFRQTILNFSQAEAVVLAVEDRLLRDYPKVGISFSKLDDFDLHPLYQIAVVGAHPAEFDEDVFYKTAKTTFDEMQANAILSAHFRNIQPVYFDVRLSCSIENGKIHWGKVFKILLFILALLAVIALAFRQQYKHSPRLRLLLADSRSSLGQMSASWQSAGRVELRRANRRLSMLFAQQRRSSRLEEEAESHAQPCNLQDSSIFHAEFANLAFSNIVYEDEQEKEETQPNFFKKTTQECTEEKLINI